MDLLIRVKQDLCQWLVFEHLLQNHAGIQGNFLIFVSLERSKYNIRLRCQVLYGGEARAYLSPEKKGEYLRHILSGLKFKA